jgi:hypothetical protein
MHGLQGRIARHARHVVLAALLTSFAPFAQAEPLISSFKCGAASTEGWEVDFTPVGGEEAQATLAAEEKPASHWKLPGLRQAFLEVAVLALFPPMPTNLDDIPKSNRPDGKTDSPPDKPSDDADVDADDDSDTDGTPGGESPSVEHAPEPASLISALLGCGLLGMTMWRRRKRLGP